MRAKLSKLILLVPILLSCQLAVGATLMVDGKLQSTEIPETEADGSLELDDESILQKSDRVGRWISEILPPKEEKEQVASIEEVEKNAEDDESEDLTDEDRESIIASILDENVEDKDEELVAEAEDSTDEEGPQTLQVAYDKLHDAYCTQKDQISELNTKISSLEQTMVGDINSQMQMFAYVMYMNQVAQNSTRPYTVQEAVPSSHIKSAQNYGLDYGLRMLSLNDLFTARSLGIGGVTNNYNYYGNQGHTQSPASPLRGVSSIRDLSELTQQQGPQIMTAPINLGQSSAYNLPSNTPRVAAIPFNFNSVSNGTRYDLGAQQMQTPTNFTQPQASQPGPTFQTPEQRVTSSLEAQPSIKLPNLQ